ncbi:Reticulon-4-interacting protein 1, mitochondrial [Nymphon striatum]|nr:Reticulon-4-interacting protein 1, mitochondrial [Nymphon striatum]
MSRIMPSYFNRSFHFCRHFSSMQAWQCYDYGGIDSLQLSTTARIPCIQSPNDVLIKVKAASVNALDVNMTDGFGRVFIGKFRELNNIFKRKTVTEFPATFGRDFSGIVVECGKNCVEFKSGDEVWGNVPVYQPGSHSEFTVSSRHLVSIKVVSKKPRNLNFVEAASVPYSCLTALSALTFSAGLKPAQLSKKRILVLGGAGGIGTFAIQWLKHGGAYVATTASPDATELLYNIGADLVINYQDENYMSDLISQSEKFDVILDAIAAAGRRDDINALLKPRCGKYVALTSPMLSNTDSFGILGGSAKSAFDLISTNIQVLQFYSLLIYAIAIQKGYIHYWAFAAPFKNFLPDVHTAYENRMIVPVIDKVFGFNEVLKAYKSVAQGHARGKTVIDFNLPHQDEELTDKPSNHLS